MNENYSGWIQGLSKRYRQSQIKAAVAVNVEMLKFYWSLGADIAHMEGDQPWGSKFIRHLSEDLRREMPEAKCFSATNLEYVRRFFKLYAHTSIFPQVGEKLECGPVQISPQVGSQIGQQVADQIIQQAVGFQKIAVENLRLKADFSDGYVI